MLLRSACALLLCVLAARAARADAGVAAQSLSAAVSLDPGLRCLERERLLAHVKMWLGSARVHAGLRVRVSQDAAGAYFDIEQEGTTRRRVFSGLPQSCDDVHAVIGFALALAIDAARLQREWLAANPAFAPRWLLGAQVSVGYAVLPEAALGFALNAERSWAPWFSSRLDVFSLYSWSQGIAGSAGRFDALLAAAALQVCAGGQPDPRLRTSVCAGAALGFVHAWGDDYARDRAGTALWIAARSGLRFELQTRPAWILDLDVISYIRAPAYRTRAAEGRELTRRPDSTGFLVSLGPAFTF